MVNPDDVNGWVRVTNAVLDLWDRVIGSKLKQLQGKRQSKKQPKVSLRTPSKVPINESYTKRLAADDPDWVKDIDDNTFEDVDIVVFFEMLDTRNHLTNARMEFTRKVFNHSDEPISSIPLQYIPDDEREAVEPQVTFKLVELRDQTNKAIDYGQDIGVEEVRRDGSHHAVFKLNNPIKAGRSATVSYTIEHHNSNFRPYLNVSAQYAPIRKLTIKFKFPNDQTGKVWRAIWGRTARHDDLEHATTVKLLNIKDRQYTTTFYNVPMCARRIPGILWEVDTH